MVEKAQGQDSDSTVVADRYVSRAVRQDVNDNHPATGSGNRGLARANKATRIRVARSGGKAPHERRGLAAASPEVRARVSSTGGKARAMDRTAMADAGRKGGEAVKRKFGSEFYSEIGRKGGAKVKALRGSEYYSEIGRKGGNSVLESRGTAHFRKIGRSARNADTTQQ